MIWRSAIRRLTRWQTGTRLENQGHTGPKNCAYCVSDTEAEQFVKDIVGTNPIRRGEELTTAVHSFRPEIYDYEGGDLASVELPEEGSYISSLRFQRTERG